MSQQPGYEDSWGKHKIRIDCPWQRSADRLANPVMPRLAMIKTIVFKGTVFI